MKLRDPEGWAATVAANSVPVGLDPEPENWPPYEQLTDDQRGDCYGAIVVIAAERWAEAMEAMLEEDATRLDTADPTVADIAAACFRRIDRDLGSLGLTGFQYGAAVSILAQVWEHGEELRRWHNLDTQIHHEGERANETGGVLNPAVLTLGRDDA
jgi:glutathione S-transferase